MALNVKKGTFVLASTDSGTKQVRGVGFQGKALLLWAGNSPTADEAWAVDVRLSVGFADDVGSVANVACFDEDGAASQNTGRFGGNDMVLRGVKASGSNVVVGFALGFSAWDADGFDLTVSTAPVANMLIHYLVLGGSDITKARKFEFNPAVAASQDVTVEAGAGKPDLVFTISPGLASAGGTPSNAGGLAFSVFNKAIERAALMLSGQDGTATMQGVSYLNAKAVTTPAAAALDSIGDIDVLINWPTDGVRFLWEDTSAAATRTVFGLALYGTFQSKVGLASSPTSAGNQDLDAGFPPLASLFFTDHLPTHTTLDSTHADGHGMSLGAYDGAAQGLVAVQMDDSAADQTAKTLVSDADVVRLTGPVAGANPTNKGIAVASHTGNNVRLAWTTPDATARRFAWVGIGAAAVGTTHETTSWTSSYIVKDHQQVEWSSSYKVSDHVTTSWSSSYTTKAHNSTAWSSSYTVKEHVTSTWSSSYSVVGLGHVTTSWTSSYTTRARLATAWSSAYTTKTKVTSTWSSSWTTVGHLTTQWSSGWSTGAHKLTTWGTSWVVKHRTSAAWSSSYTVRGTATTAWSSSYLVYEHRQTAWSSRYSIITTVPQLTKFTLFVRDEAATNLHLIEQTTVLETRHVVDDLEVDE